MNNRGFWIFILIMLLIACGSIGLIFKLSTDDCRNAGGRTEFIPTGWTCRH